MVDIIICNRLIVFCFYTQSNYSVLKIALLIYIASENRYSMSFLDQVWNKIAPIYNSIQSHNFSLELLEGRLEEQIFSRYLSQTSSLLIEFIEAMSIILAKTNHSSQVADLLRTTIYELESEHKLCCNILSRMNYQYSQEIALPSCTAYVNFLIARAAAEDIPVAISVILPRFLCFYHLASNTSHFANYISKHCIAIIEHYRGASFSNFISKAQNLINEIAADQSPIIVQRMEEAFMHSALFQWHVLQDIYYLDNRQFAMWDMKSKTETRFFVNSA